MEQSKFNKYQEASKILNEVLNECKNLCNKNYFISYISNLCDQMIDNKLSKIFTKKIRKINCITYLYFCKRNSLS